jgi:hypothetical protein
MTQLACSARVRWGLGIVVITFLVGLAAELLALGIYGVREESIAGLTPLGVLGATFACVGWWLFASRDLGPDSPSLRWWLRVAVSGSLLVWLLQRAGAGHPWMAVLAWPFGGATFYLSLILLGRKAKYAGDTRLASASVWCMIFAPVLMLAGFATMFGLSLFMIRDLDQMKAALGGAAGAQGAPATPTGSALDLPPWVLLLPLAPIAMGALWYMATLTRAWFGMLRSGPPPAVPVAA